MKTNPFVMLTWSSLKAYFRNRGAIFFSLLVPLMIMGIFGLINFGGGTSSVNIGVVDQAHNQVSDRLITNLKGIKAVKLHTGSLDAEKQQLQQGNRDLVAVLPASIGQGSTAITAYYNQGNPQNSQVAMAIMNQFVDRASFAFAGVSPALTLDAKPVQSRNLTYVGNLLYLLIVGIVGGGVFLAMGLAISGASKSEETAAPIANLVSLPLMFLSGVFFSRSSMPEWLQTITQFSPLTYVTDALRSISIDGASLWAIRTDLLGILIWLAIAAVIANRLFKWEVV